MFKLAFEIDDQKIKIGINLFGKHILFLYTESIYEMIFSKRKKSEVKEKEIKDKKDWGKKQIKGSEFKKIFRIIQNLGKTIRYDSAHIEIPTSIIDEPDLFPLLSILQGIPKMTIGLSHGTKIKILFKVRFISAFKLVFMLLKP